MHPSSDVQEHSASADRTVALSDFVLTGDDVATAEFGVMHMLNWWRAQRPSSYRTDQIAKCRALLTKLDRICDHAYPHALEDGGLDYGSEPILKLDDDVVAQTRRPPAGQQ